jgi:hypothetical protein
MDIETDQNNYTSIEFEARGSKLGLVFSVYAHNELEDVGGLLDIAEQIASDHLVDHADSLKKCWANGVYLFEEMDEFGEEVEEIDEDLYLSVQVTSWDLSEDNPDVFIYPKGTLPLLTETSKKVLLKECFMCPSSTKISANLSREKLDIVFQQISDSMGENDSVYVEILPEWDTELGASMRGLNVKNVNEFLKTFAQQVIANGHVSLKIKDKAGSQLHLDASKTLNFKSDDSGAIEKVKSIMAKFDVGQDDKAKKINDVTFYSYSSDDELESQDLVNSLNKFGFS